MVGKFSFDKLNDPVKMLQTMAAERRAAHELLLILNELAAPHHRPIQFVTGYCQFNPVINNSSLQIHILACQKIIFENSLVICATSIPNHCLIVYM
jgi:hypothetical protein